MNIEHLLLLLATFLIVFVVFYASAAFVARDWSVSPEYLFRILIVSLVAAFVVPFVSELGGEHGISDLMLLLSFVVLVVVVRYVMIENLAVSDDWLASMIVSLIGVSLIFVVNELSGQLFDVRLPTIL